LFGVCEEREREQKFGEGGIIETKFAVLKVPRQCPLVLLVCVRLVCGICLILNFEGVGEAARGGEM
jgi:hypothetical protein